MFKLYKPRLFACIFLVSVPAAAEPPEGPLTLLRAQQRVLQSSPELQALGYDVAAQDGLVQQAAFIPNPELSALVEDRQAATRSTTIQITQPIELGGKRGARMAAAGEERALAQAVLSAKRAELRARTSKLFYALLAAQARVALADTALALSKQAVDAATTRVAAGKNSPVDASRARIAMSGAQMELAQSTSELEQARESLAALWGGAGQGIGQAAGALDQLTDAAPLAALEARLPQAPAILIARQELQRRIALERVESARRSPDLALTVGSKKDEQLGRRQAVFGVSVPLPLFDRNQGRLHESAQRSAQAWHALAAAQATLASELRLSHGRLTSARAQAAALQEQHLPAARSAFEATRKGYDFGKFSLLEVFDAQRVLIQAQTQLLRVQADAHAAAADIERILGAASAAPSQETP